METLTITDSNQFSNLRWPDYHDNILSTFRSLKADEDFVDVTLSCEEEQYSAHKVVLSACSPYFRKLLKNNPCQHPIIIMRDVPEEDLRSLIHFMYRGEVQVHRSNMKSFLRTAEVLQIKGLLDHPLLIDPTYQKSNSTSPNICENPSQDHPEDYTPTHKRPRHTAPRPTIADSPPLPIRQSSPTQRPPSSSHSRHNGDRRESWPRPASPRDRDRDMDTSSIKYIGRSTPGGNGIDAPGVDKSLLSQALEKGEDSASDTTGSERPESASMDNVKSESGSHMGRDMDMHHGGINALFPPGLEALYRQAGFPNFLGLGGHNGGMGGPMGMPQMPGPSTTHIGLQSHAANPTIGGKLEMMRVRATDPRPCPKCGKIYRSAHTLRTHMEDKHTICPGYRCVLCGTVAKSRNSLHSHMSRQHRGISTKDLPVLPMPSPFDPELASKLLSKAGVKVSASELAARASPTAPRRSDLPKLDNNLSIHNQHQFPLPPSMPHGHLGFGRSSDRDHRDHSDPEDLRVPVSSSPYSTPFSSSHSITSSFPMMGAGLRPPNSGKDFPGMGGAGSNPLLDAYLSMISASAAGENNMAAALNFQNNPAAARAAMAMAASGMNLGHLNGLGGLGKDGAGYGSDRDDGEGELGSDAENDDISEAGDPPTQLTSTPAASGPAAIGIAAGNSGD